MADFSDLDRQIEQLKRCEIIRETEVKALCAKAREILVEEGNVQRVDSPVTVSQTSSDDSARFFADSEEAVLCVRVFFLHGV